MKIPRVLAIGDIHGCLGALDELLRLFDPQPDDSIITLGDVIDRGPQSQGVINRLLELSTRCQFFHLMGNHERMMLDACNGKDYLKDWLSVGGLQTMESYSPTGFANDASLKDVPKSHWEYLEAGLLHYEIDTHFFVHANAYPEIPLADQPEYMLLWEYFDKPNPHESGKIMVCGHTSQRSGKPKNIGHAICIDTNAWNNGWLTGLEIRSGRILQTNQHLASLSW